MSEMMVEDDSLTVYYSRIYHTSHTVPSLS